MLIEYLPLLNRKRIILASASPRRKKALRKLVQVVSRMTHTFKGLKFEVIVSNFQENLDKAQFTPEAYVMETAKGKALSVYVCPHSLQ